MPRGGARPGAGRKKKRRAGNELAPVFAHPSSVSAPKTLPVVDEADAPNDLSMDERRVWMELAPHALANRTLTDATSLAFRMLCRNVVLERRLAANVEEVGGASHRGLIARVDVELGAFGLMPSGKPMAAPKDEQLVNPLERFLKHG